MVVEGDDNHAVFRLIKNNQRHLMHKTKFSNMDSDSILHGSYIQHC